MKCIIVFISHVSEMIQFHFYFKIKIALSLPFTLKHNRGDYPLCSHFTVCVAIVSDSIHQKKYTLYKTLQCDIALKEAHKLHRELLYYWTAVEGSSLIFLGECLAIAKIFVLAPSSLIQFRPITTG